jgi:hypothetical protein
LYFLVNARKIGIVLARAARGHRQDRQGAKIANAFLKWIIITNNLVNLGDLGESSVLRIA